MSIIEIIEEFGEIGSPSIYLLTKEVFEGQN
jgi:hypothetical protein